MRATGDKFLDGLNGCVWNSRRLFQNGVQKFPNGSLGAAAKRWDELSRHKQPIANDHWSLILHQDKSLRPSVVCIRETDDDDETFNHCCHRNGDTDYLQRAAAARVLRKRAASVDCSRTMIEQQRDLSSSHRAVGCRMGGRKRSWSLSHLDGRDIGRREGRKFAREAPATTGESDT